MFQTAFPFGYLIQFLLFVGAFVVALVLIARGLYLRDRALYRSGLIVAGLIAMMVGLAAAQPSVDEWTPRFPRDVLYGRWVAEERRLDLRADGTYTLHEESSVKTGRYHLDDWNLRLLDTTGHPLPTPPSVLGLRVVEANGEYRIINDPVEPDIWDRWMGYRRTPRARVP